MGHFTLSGSFGFERNDLAVEAITRRADLSFDASLFKYDGKRQHAKTETRLTLVKSEYEPKLS